MQYKRNKYEIVHKTYRSKFDKSYHLKLGCILDHGHKPLIQEEKW